MSEKEEQKSTLFLLDNTFYHNKPALSLVTGVGVKFTRHVTRMLTRASLDRVIYKLHWVRHAIAANHMSPAR